MNNTHRTIITITSALLVSASLVACTPDFEITSSSPAITTEPSAITETSENTAEVVETPEATVSEEETLTDGLTDIAGYEVEVVEYLPTPAEEYDRQGLFGNWADPDGNCFDGRNEALQNTLTDVVVNDQCQVVSGVLVDPYTGYVENFERGQGTSQLVPVDHIVPAHYAWYVGAGEWSREQRVAFYNDPINLVATTQFANSGKSNLLPSEMPETFRNGSTDTDYDFIGQCVVATGWLETATRYDFPILTNDANTIAEWMEYC